MDLAKTLPHKLKAKGKSGRNRKKKKKGKEGMKRWGLKMEVTNVQRRRRGGEGVGERGEWSVGGVAMGARVTGWVVRLLVSGGKTQK